MAKGYSNYQYETSPRKLEPEYNPNKRKTRKEAKQNEEIKKQIKQKAKQNIKKKKKQKILQRKALLYIAVVFTILLAISYRNSLINEDFSKVKELKGNLSEVQKENEQLKVDIESTVNLTSIEQAAKEKLGMQRLSNEQKIYVSLPKKDYVQPSKQEIEINSKTNWFESIINNLIGN